MNWKFWIGIIIGVLFLFLAFRKVDLDEISIALKSAKYLYTIPAILLTILGLWLRSLRWHFMLQQIKRIGLNSLFSATMIGFMANYIFPARLGEFVRAYAIGEKEQISKSASFATIIFERILDGITVLTCLLILFIFFSFPLPNWMKNGVYLAGGIYIFSLLFLILLKLQTGKILKMVQFIVRPLPEKMQDKLLGILNSFITGLQILHDFKNILICILLSIITWIPPGIIVHLILTSVDIHLPLHVSYFILTIFCIGVMIPSAPGFIGTIQFLSVACLALYGISRSQALSFSILFQISQYIPIIIIGLIYFFIEGFSFAQIKRSQKIEDIEPTKS